MHASLRLLVAFVLALLLLGSTPPAEAQFVPESSCGAAFCAYLPLTGRALPLKIVTQFSETGWKSSIPLGLIVVVENISAFTLYDVTARAVVRFPSEDRIVDVKLEAPAIPPGQRAWLSASLNNDSRLYPIVAVDPIFITGYSEEHTPPSVGLTLLDSVLNCSRGSFDYTVRNDTPYMVGNLYISPRQQFTDPDNFTSLTIGPGEVHTLHRFMSTYDQIYLCPALIPFPPPVDVQGQVLP